MWIYVKRKTVCVPHRILCKVWISLLIRATISINTRAEIGPTIIRGREWSSHNNGLMWAQNNLFFRFSSRPDSSNSFDWFSERQTKVMRYIRTFLQRNSTDQDLRAVNQTRIMYKACMDTGNSMSNEWTFFVNWDKLITLCHHFNSGQMDTNGLKPVLNYLSQVHLPNYPSILDTPSDTDKPFDWVETVATVKRIFGADIVIGFDIFPDPTNRLINRIVLGTPETESVLPL